MMFCIAAAYYVPQWGYDFPQWGYHFFGGVTVSAGGNTSAQWESTLQPRIREFRKWWKIASSTMMKFHHEAISHGSACFGGVTIFTGGVTIFAGGVTIPAGGNTGTLLQRLRSN